ncbi:MAG: phosphatase PAP2 family protein, partial [Psychromonas sp.]
MKKLTLALMIAASFSSNNALAENPITESISDEYVEAGDILQIAIPVAGLAATWFHDDKEGAKQLVKSFASTMAIVHATKQTVGRNRPNDSNDLSFPSAHTAAAFSGAAFLQSRYGAKWGVPAYALASYVGASRVHGNKHYADDVLAGASIAFLVNQYFVSPYQDDGLQIRAIPQAGGLAIGIHVDNSYFDQEREVGSVRNFSNYKHRFQLDVGFSNYDTIASATLDGDSHTVDETQIATAINYRYEIEPGRYFNLDVAPNEARSVTTDSGGLLTSLRDWNMTATYQFNAFNNAWLDIDLAGGITGHYLDLGQVNSEDVYKEATHFVVLPTINTVATVKLTDNLSWVNKLQIEAISKDSVQQVETGL